MFQQVEVSDLYYNRKYKIIADDEPEYDSAGFTEDDRIVNGQYKVISNENK
jgi:hypothetical protein